MTNELAERIVNAFTELEEFLRGGKYPPSADGQALLIKSAQYGREGRLDWLKFIASNPSISPLTRDEKKRIILGWEGAE